MGILWALCLFLFLYYGANATENITLLRTLAGPGGTGYGRCLHVSIVARISSAQKNSKIIVANFGEVNTALLGSRGLNYLTRMSNSPPSASDRQRLLLHIEGVPHARAA